MLSHILTTAAALLFLYLLISHEVKRRRYLRDIQAQVRAARTQIDLLEGKIHGLKTELSKWNPEV